MDEALRAPVEEDAPQPIELAARFVAHIFHRLPGIRRIEKRLEGRDKTAGIGSDLISLLVQLYRRNESTIKAEVMTVVKEHIEKQAAKKREMRSGDVPPGGGS